MGRAGGGPVLGGVPVLRRRTCYRRAYPRGAGCAMWIVALEFVPAALFTLVVVVWTVLVWLGLAS